MKHNSSIFILSLFPLFNKELMHNFESFDKEHSSYFYSTFLLNHREITKRESETSNIIFCFDKNDEGYLTDDFKNFGIIDFIEKPVLKVLSEKYFQKSANNIVIFSNSIGITPGDINTVFNLLSTGDEAVVLGKSINNSLSFFGFNSFNSGIFEDVELLNLNYNSFLNNVVKFEHFVNVLNNFMLINTIEDFKYLYDNLSKKESFTYCSQEIHERFTNLFIEYKALLK
jgi:hypothetical protein